MNFFEKTNLDIIVNLIAEYKELAYFAFDIEKFLPLKNVVKKVLKKIFYNILESKKTLFSDFLKNYKKSIYFKIFSLNNENFSSEEKIINKNHNEIFSSMYFASMKNIYIKENGEVLSNQFKKMHKKIIEIIFSISEINFSPKSYGNFYLSNFQQKNFDGIEIYFE